tara:strand:+ start:487 stop:705 length:219 start_codon:yes stop_codon:yes gene_type:complete
MLGISSINLTDSNKINAKQRVLDEKMNPVLTGIDFLGTYSYKAEVWCISSKNLSLTRLVYLFIIGNSFKIPI